jgi:hypothetical protein
MKLTYLSTLQKVPTLDIYEADVKKIAEVVMKEAKL